MFNLKNIKATVSNITIPTVQFVPASRLEELIAEREQVVVEIKAMKKARKSETSEYAALIVKRDELTKFIARTERVLELQAKFARSPRKAVSTTVDATRTAKDKVVTVTEPVTTKVTESKDKVVVRVVETKVVKSLRQRQLERDNSKAILAFYAEELAAFDAIYEENSQVESESRVTLRQRVDSVRAQREAKRAERKALEFYSN